MQWLLMRFGHLEAGVDQLVSLPAVVDERLPDFRPRLVPLSTCSKGAF